MWSLEAFDFVESWMSLSQSRPAAGTYFLPEPKEIQSFSAKTTVVRKNQKGAWMLMH